MPLRDHFRPPLDIILSWEELHGQWPAVIVQQLRKQLPPGYAVGPRVHSGSQIEIDVAAFEKDGPSLSQRKGEGNGGVAVSAWAPALPSLDVETTLPDYDEYEVRVYDAARGRMLVAAIELVSPANKDRPEHRNVFVGSQYRRSGYGPALQFGCRFIDLHRPRRSSLWRKFPLPSLRCLVPLDYEGETNASANVVARTGSGPTAADAAGVVEPNAFRPARS